MLNLLPLPGLDGGGVVRPWLNPPWDRYYDQFAGVGMLLLFALLFLPLINGWFFGAVNDFGNLIGVPILNGAGYGYRLFQFWRA
jgi:Zn-dependent protease